ncbi:unnamed protein product [Trifolium pratense]|uniref:Uncharacterized protein n=1 Tax=Trifolium pratense TaxID=57577 RepID=A0ACB0JSV0_TRIPR|nr:unnamed protein product [Trifolium pratense]
MTSEQRKVYDTIMIRVNENKPGVFFLYGYGGTWKTFIWRVMSAALRPKGEIVLTVASSGIAALLIPGDLILIDDQLIQYALADIEMMLRSCGKSLKDYPPKPRADTSLVPDIQNSLIHDELNYKRQSLAEEHVRLMSTMTSEQRKVYDTIMTRVNENKPGVFFRYGYGGTWKTFIWRAMQIQPLIAKGTRPKVVHAPINSSVLWNFCEVLTLSKNMRLLGGASSTDVEQRRLFYEWVLGVGDGEIGDDNDDDLELDIASDLLIPNSANQTRAPHGSTF